MRVSAKCAAREAPGTPRYRTSARRRYCPLARSAGRARRPGGRTTVETGTFRGFEITFRDPGIALFQFNEPERLNGMTQALKRDLVEQLIQAQLDDAVRVVVFTGSGRAFCAGDDMSGGYQRADPRPGLVPPIPGGHRTPIGTYDAL